MNRLLLHTIVFTGFFNFLFLSLTAQQNISVKASVDKNKILIGEQLHLTLEVHSPATEPMRFFLVDSIPHFEILERQKIDTSDKNGGIELKQSLTLTSFDSGHWAIPSFELGMDKYAVTDSIPIDIIFSSPFDPNQDYHDIKDVIDVQAGKKKKSDWYIYAIASFIVVAGIVYILTRKKKSVAPRTVEIDPYTEAKRQLENLQKEDLPAKQFSSKLVDIFRYYMFRRKNIASMQKTTDDLIVQLRTLKVDDKNYTDLAQTLRMSDFVKFARYEPSTEDKKRSFEMIKHSIEIIERSITNISPASNA